MLVRRPDDYHFSHLLGDTILSLVSKQLSYMFQGWKIEFEGQKTSIRNNLTDS